MPLFGYLGWTWEHARVWTPQLLFVGEGVGHFYSTYMFLTDSGHTGGWGWGLGGGGLELWAGSVYDIVGSLAGLSALVYTSAVPQYYTAH